MVKWLSLHPWPQNPALLAVHTSVFTGVLHLLPTFLPLPAPGEQADTDSLCGGKQKQLQQAEDDAGCPWLGLPRAFHPAALSHNRAPEMSASGINSRASTCEDQQELQESELPAVTLLCLLRPAL